MIEKYRNVEKWKKLNVEITKTNNWKKKKDEEKVRVNKTDDSA